VTDAARLEADQPAAPLLPPARPSLYDRFSRLVTDGPRARRLYGWLGPAIVVLLAAVLRLWNLAAAHDLMNQFDETYYVKDAWTLLNLGYEASWPAEANASFLSGDVDVFTTNPAFVVHPPLGKWIIGLGMLLLGPESGWGWRITTALLDTSLTFFVLLAFLFVLRDREHTMTRIAETVAARYDGDAAPSWGPVLWNRPWVIAAGAALGAASAVKWSGAWVLAGLGVYLVVTDALARRRAGVLFWPTDAVRQGLATFTLFVPVALAVYLASWTGWLVTDRGYDRQAGGNALESLWLYHVAMYKSTAGIMSGHSYASPAWQWPLLWRPTGVYYHHDALGVNGCTAPSGCVDVISTMPNPLIWYAGVAAVLYLAYRFIVARDWRYALVLTGIAVTYAPWLFLPQRTIFQFYTVLVLPFMLLALTFALKDIAGPPSADSYRRLTGQRLVLVFLAVALALSAFWYPIISAMTVPYDFWHLHMWLNSWV
jgi:dolichyl-phosphate-mannose--protein O-mannosyl transferase